MTIAIRSLLRRNLMSSRWAPYFAAAYAFAIYWFSASAYQADRHDYLYLSDALIHGRLWVTSPPPGAPDAVTLGGHVFLPMGPAPAVLFAPLVALFGVGAVVPWEQTINAGLAAVNVGLAWVLIGRFVGDRGARRTLWVTALFAFGTAEWWVTTRGGVWHIAQLVTVGLTLFALVEATGPRRAWVMGLAGTAAFMTRAPLALAMPLYLAIAVFGVDAADGGLTLSRHRRRIGAGATVVLIGILGVGLLAAYNFARFGNPLESGYALAPLFPVLDGTRDHGLFSVAYLPRNLDYLLWHLPTFGTSWPFAIPDGYGLSLFITSPALLLAFRSRLTHPFLAATGATALLVLLPDLLYYGGGWFQFGFRYFLDSIPFVLILVADGASRDFRWGWRALIVFGIAVGVYGVIWAYGSGIA